MANKVFQEGRGLSCYPWFLVVQWPRPLKTTLGGVVCNRPASSIVYGSMESSIRLGVAELPSISVIIVCAIRRLRVTVVLSAPFTVSISVGLTPVGVTPISINVTAHIRLQFKFRANRPTIGSTQMAGSASATLINLDS